MRVLRKNSPAGDSVKPTANTARAASAAEENVTHPKYPETVATFATEKAEVKAAEEICELETTGSVVKVTTKLEKTDETQEAARPVVTENITRKISSTSGGRPSSPSKKDRPKSPKKSVDETRSASIQPSPTSAFDKVQPKAGKPVSSVVEEPTTQAHEEEAATEIPPIEVLPSKCNLDDDEPVEAKESTTELVVDVAVDKSAASKINSIRSRFETSGITETAPQKPAQGGSRNKIKEALDKFSRPEQLSAPVVHVEVTAGKSIKDTVSAFQQKKDQGPIAPRKVDLVQTAKKEAPPLQQAPAAGVDHFQPTQPTTLEEECPIVEDQVPSDDDEFEVLAEDDIMERPKAPEPPSLIEDDMPAGADGEQAPAVVQSVSKLISRFEAPAPAFDAKASAPLVEAILTLIHNPYYSFFLAFFKDTKQ